MVPVLTCGECGFIRPMATEIVDGERKFYYNGCPKCAAIKRKKSMAAAQAMMDVMVKGG